MAQCKISLKKLSMNLPDSVDRHYLCHGVHGTFLAQMRPLNLFIVCVLKKIIWILMYFAIMSHSDQNSWSLIIRLHSNVEVEIEIMIIYFWIRDFSKIMPTSKTQNDEYLQCKILGQYSLYQSWPYHCKNTFKFKIC